MIMQVTGSIFTFKCWLVKQFLKMMLHPCLGTACQHLFRVCFIISPKGCQMGEFCWLNYCRLLVMLLKYIITNVNNSHQLQADCSSYRLVYSKNKRFWKSSESSAEELGWFCVFCGEVGHGPMIVMEGRGGTCIFLFMSLNSSFLFPHWSNIPLMKPSNLLQSLSSDTFPAVFWQAEGEAILVAEV